MKTGAKNASYAFWNPSPFTNLDYPPPPPSPDINPNPPWPEHPTLTLTATVFLPDVNLVWCLPILPSTPTPANSSNLRWTL